MSASSRYHGGGCENSSVGGYGAGGPLQSGRFGLVKELARNSSEDRADLSRRAACRPSSVFLSCRHGFDV